jgi:hypothetical protein
MKLLKKVEQATGTTLTKDEKQAVKEVQTALNEDKSKAEKATEKTGPFVVRRVEC